RLHAQHLAHDSFAMQQARVRPEGTLHHSIDVMQRILRKDVVRQRIERVDQLIEKRNRGFRGLCTHWIAGGNIGSIAHSYVWLLLFVGLCGFLGCVVIGWGQLWPRGSKKKRGRHRKTFRGQQESRTAPPIDSSPTNPGLAPADSESSSCSWSSFVP